MASPSQYSTSSETLTRTARTPRIAPPPPARLPPPPRRRIARRAALRCGHEPHAATSARENARCRGVKSRNAPTTTPEDARDADASRRSRALVSISIATPSVSRRARWCWSPAATRPARRAASDATRRSRSSSTATRTATRGATLRSASAAGRSLESSASASGGGVEAAGETSAARSATAAAKTSATRLCVSASRPRGPASPSPRRSVQPDENRSGAASASVFFLSSRAFLKNASDVRVAAETTRARQPGVDPSPPPVAESSVVTRNASVCMRALACAFASEPSRGGAPGRPP